MAVEPLMNERIYAYSQLAETLTVVARLLFSPVQYGL
jgi:hypothetical protein